MKRKFVEQFTDEELERLLRVIDHKHGTQLIQFATQGQLRERFPWNAVKRRLYERFFPLRPSHEFYRLLRITKAIKAWLENEVAKIPSETFKTLRASPLPPKIPSNLRLTHPIAGVVPVTVHAWNRFIERFEYQQKNPTQIAKRLQQLFERSRPTTITTEHRVKRIINNNFENAHYYAIGRHIRFVISETSGMLMTVEDPKISY